MLLGDLGADVIKIEPPGTGDQTRGSMGFKMKGADSLGFLNMNRNKRSIDAGPEVAGRQGSAADAGEGCGHPGRELPPGALRRMGLGYEVLKDVNPRWSTPASRASARPAPGPTAPAST
jgi:formyl-CoA transferase